MSSPRPLLLASILLLAALVTPTPATANTQGLRDHVAAYATDEQALRGFYDTSASPERHERLMRFLDEQQAALDALPAAEDVSTAIDRHLLGRHIAYQRDLLNRSQDRRQALAALLPFTDEMLTIIEADTNDPFAVAGVLSKLAAQVKELNPAKAEPAPSAPDAIRAAEATLDLRGELRSWYAESGPFDPVFAWWVQEPNSSLDAELTSYARRLMSDVAKLKVLPTSLRERSEGSGGDEAENPLIGDPIGREALLEDLAHEQIPYTPEQLIVIGERELAWCREQAIIAANEMGHGDDWRAAMEAVKSDHVAPGQQHELVREQALAAIEFLDENDLVSIPDLCRETWRLEMLSPQQQRVLPFAAYGGQRMLVAYAANEMDHVRKQESMRGNNIHFSRIVVPHELIPGHHLQRFAAERNRTYRSLFSTPFLVEGWALHWEMVFWDNDYAQSPQNRMGMLFWRSHRAARIIVSLKFHLGQMSPQEMIDFLVDEVGHERDGATSEVRRYVGDSYSPLYQCAYMLGGLQLQSLHKDLVGTGRMSQREFHDAVLEENAIPIAMIRAALLDLPPEQVAESWYFAGEIDVPTTTPATE